MQEGALNLQEEQANLQERAIELPEEPPKCKKRSPYVSTKILFLTGGQSI
ncbi:hypothetical protein [Gracilibacillus massiliensis]|nr:hypothetical protein [Gracilibacillus massiliensis]